MLSTRGGGGGGGGGGGDGGRVVLFKSMSLKGPRESLYGTSLVPVTGFIIKSHGTSALGSCGVFPVQHRARLTIQLYIQNVYMI